MLLLSLNMHCMSAFSIVLLPMLRLALKRASSQTRHERGSSKLIFA